MLRIENIDDDRCLPEYVTALMEDMLWLGLAWDGEPLLQSARHEAYRAALDQLERLGIVYEDEASHDEMIAALHAPHHGLSLFDSEVVRVVHERDIVADGDRPAWRLSMVKAREIAAATMVVELLDGEEVSRPADPWRFGDPVIARRDSGTTYHLSSVVDDIHQGVTHVVRGLELRELADLHAVLRVVLGSQPPVFVHHDIVRDNEGNRLSKRNNAQSLRSLRAAGWTPAEILDSVGAPQPR